MLVTPPTPTTPTTPTSATTPPAPAPATGPTTTDGATRGLLAVLTAALGFGLTPAVASWAFATGLTVEAASLWRAVIPAVLTLPAVVHLRRWRSEMLLAAGAGALAAVGVAAFYRAIDSGAVDAATAVYYTFPIVVVVLGTVLTGVRPRRREVAAVALVAIGALAVVGPAELGPAGLEPVLTAGLAPLTWGLLLVVLATRLAPVPVAASMFATFAGGALALAPVAALGDTGRWVPAGADQWWAVVVLTLLTRVVPATLITWGAPRVGGTATAVVGTLELTVALTAAWLLGGSRPTPLAVLGAGLLVVGALAAASTTRGGAPTAGPTPDPAGDAPRPPDRSQGAACAAVVPTAVERPQERGRAPDDRAGDHAGDRGVSRWPPRSRWRAPEPPSACAGRRRAAR